MTLTPEVLCLSFPAKTATHAPPQLLLPEKMSNAADYIQITVYPEFCSHFSDGS